MNSHRASKRDIALRLCDIGAVISMGLVPSFHLTGLNLVVVFMIISIALRGRAVLENRLPFHWAHLAILQFIVFFGLNALLFETIEGNRPHYRALALENWTVTLVGFGAVYFFLSGGADRLMRLRRDLDVWLPVGLLLSFVVMTVIFLLDIQGTRPRALASNTLSPPIWFLALTLISFCRFHEMPGSAKALRIGLMAMAALMAVYSGGRMILALWMLSLMALGFYVAYLKAGAERPMRDAMRLLIGFAVLIGLFLIVDFLIGTKLTWRVTHTIDVLRTEGLTSENFMRLKIWDAALQVIASSWPWGAGQVNERFLLHQILETKWWFRAHQTYLSYLIAGGIPALISGLIFQAAGLSLLRRDTIPAALGLVGVLGLSGLTDSVFQSFVYVQFYSLLVIVLWATGPHLRK